MMNFPQAQSYTIRQNISLTLQLLEQPLEEITESFSTDEIL